MENWIDDQNCSTIEKEVLLRNSWKVPENNAWMRVNNKLLCPRTANDYKSRILSKLIFTVTSIIQPAGYKGFRETQTLSMK